MKRWSCLVLLWVAAAFGVARADNLDPCAFTLVQSPAHPSSSERIGLRLTGGIFGPGAGPGAAQATMRSGVIYLDVVLTRERDAFAGYHPIGDVILDVFDYVGPLAAGVYPVVITTRSFVDDVTNVPCPAVVQSLRVYETAAPVQTVDAVEFYDAIRDRYFVTTDALQILRLGTTVGWVRTGQQFKVYTVNGSDGRAVPVYWFTSPPVTGIDASFFTASYREYLVLLRTPQWQFEGQPFEVGLPDTLTGECHDGRFPVYRLFNPRNGDHRWTTDAGLRASLVAQGWIPEGYGDVGVAMCAPPA